MLSGLAAKIVDEARLRRLLECFGDSLQPEQCLRAAMERSVAFQQLIAT
jgi:hypothetical protein